MKISENKISSLAPVKIKFERLTKNVYSMNFHKWNHTATEQDFKLNLFLKFQLHNSQIEFQSQLCVTISIIHEDVKYKIEFFV